MQLSEINIYPVKSLRGISVTEWPVDARGLKLDRHWMLINDAGHFITQRQFPQLSLVNTSLTDNQLTIDSQGFSSLQLPIDETNGEQREVEIWKQSITACSSGATASEWFSDYLGEKTHLVFLPEEVIRPVDPDYANPSDQVGFADGFPFLIISEASLDDLNQRLDVALPMQRFRPNLVIKHSAAYAEDDWQHLSIGNIDLNIVKPCARCAITTINPETAARSKEPLATLRHYRKYGNLVYFGQNAIHQNQGILKINDKVTIK
ncbi:MAG: MOSC domain-containing protein [Gammaproteobacteria bacterium]|nr:MOSC domain-containing protein [Gammaproteobacteria bacterium]